MLVLFAIHYVDAFVYRRLLDQARRSALFVAAYDPQAIQ